MDDEPTSGLGGRLAGGAAMLTLIARSTTTTLRCVTSVIGQA
jgi:hypothetical protein